MTSLPKLESPLNTSGAIARVVCAELESRADTSGASRRRAAAAESSADGADAGQRRSDTAERAAHLRAAAERSAMLIRRMHTDQRCAWANRAWLDYTGAEERALLGAAWLERVHPDDRAACLHELRVADEGRGLYRAEYRVRDRCGDYAWVLEIGAPRHRHDGTVVGYLATAVVLTAERESARRHERLRALCVDLLVAEERERRQLAVDVHDGLAQLLALLQLKHSALRAQLDVRHTAALDEIDTLIRQSNSAARSLTVELSPPMLHDLGLEPAVHWLIESLQPRYGIQIDVDDDGAPKPTSERTRVVLYRSIRELLLNAGKHAHARKVLVRLRSDAASLLVDVEDDGIGMDPQLAVDGGCGLFSIRERLGHIGGAMHIDSTSGGGTRIHLSAPLDSATASRRQEKP